MKRNLAVSLLAASMMCGFAPFSLAADKIEVTGSLPSSVTVEQLFSNAKYGQPLLSPDGKRLAVVSPVKGRMALVVIDLESRKASLAAADPEWDVTSPVWVNNSRLLFSISDNKVSMADNRGGGLFAVNIDSTGFRMLSKTVKQAQADGDMRFSGRRYIGRVGDDSNDIYVTYNERNGDGGEDDFGGVDVYRLDTKTGKSKLQTFNSPGKVVSWVMDNAGQVRIAMSVRNDKASKQLMAYVYHRENNEAPWVKIEEHRFLEDGYTPIGFDADNKTMYVSGRGDADTVGLYTWDFTKNAPKELLFRHPRADYEGTLIREASTQKVIGLAIDAMKPEQYYFDQAYADLQASIDVTLPKAYNSMQKRGSRVLIRSTSDINPGEVLLYDEQKKTLESILAFKEDIKPELMSPMQVVEYPARDGLAIPAYLTLPKSKAESQLPLVVFVHGGPHARDEWGYNPYVQHLASRGYAVLQPQFRMSTGLGWKLHHAGWKQWGLAMQDDLTDGVEWLVKQGKVDPKRVCIMGASYGGYATMYGLEKDPDLYKCGVNFVGVTDISLLFSVSWSDTSGSAWSKYKQRDMHGDPDKDMEYMRKTSAISDENVAKLKAPVLMAYGSEDVRVPLIHGEKMRDKLLKKGNTVEWMVFNGEGHGWAKPENKYLWANSYENFLNKYIGDKAQVAGK
ncbi:S9 family peptidase [Chitinimonas naiadis]